MKGYLLLTGLLGFSAMVRGDMPPVGSMPAPPSVALNPAPFDASADVTILVNVIPADAKFVIHARLSSSGTHLVPEDAAATGANLSQTFEQLRPAAQQRGANLIVVLGAEHGIDVPVRQAAQPLKLRPNDPSVTVILFRREKPMPPTEAEARVRFTTRAAASKGANLNYKISLQSAPPGADMTFWVYMNIARFVSDATKHGFDTVALRSTTDPKFENVSLPGCDDPVRISLSKPELDVTIYQSGPQNR